MRRVWWLVLLCLVFIGGYVGSVSPVEAAGILIKNESMPAVYYVAADGKRYVFPNEHIFFSWYPNFESVKTVSDTALAGYQIGGNITYRVGTRLVKLTNDPKVYAVEPGGVLRWVTTEAVAKTLYGTEWAKRVDDLPDSFFPAYVLGAPLDGTVFPEGWIGRDVTSGQTVVYTSGGFRPFTKEGEENNRVVSLDPVPYDFSAVPMGVGISAGLPFLSDAAQDGYGKRLAHDVVLVGESKLKAIFQGESTQQIGGLFVSVKAPTVIKNLAFTLKAVTNADADFDAGGLLYGNGTEIVEPNLTNIRLVDDFGRSLLSTGSVGFDKNQDGAVRLVLTGSHTLPAGVSHVRLVADVFADAPAKERYVVNYDVTSSIFEVGGFRTESVSPASIDGSEVEVSTGGIEISRASGGGRQVLVGSSDRSVPRLAGFVLKNPLAESVTVQELTFTGYIDEGEESDDFALGFDADRGSNGRFVKEVLPELVASDGSGRTLGRTPVGSDGKAHFTGLALTLPARTSVTVYVGGDIAEAAPFDLYPDRVAFDIKKGEDDVVAKRADGREVDIFGDAVNGGASPSDYVVIAKHGELLLEGAGSGGARLIMGEVRKGTFTLKLTASDIEDMRVDTLAMRLASSEAVRSIKTVELRYPDAITGGLLYTSAQIQSGAATFHPTDLIIPRDKKVDVQVLVTLLSEAQGAMSGDEIGWIFEPETFLVTGVPSGITLNKDDFGRFLTNSVRPGGEVPVRRGAPIMRLLAEAIEDPQRKGEATPVFGFTVTSLGEGAKITKLAFKIEPSDVGYDLNDVEADNDLLEYFADLPLSGFDHDAIANLLDEDGEEIGDGSAASLRYTIYDESLRQRVSATGVDTARGDYGILTYEFRTPILATSTPQTFTLELDTRGLALGSRTVKVTLLGADDFGWNDGSTLAFPESGDGVNQLPFSGSPITFR